MSSPRFNRLRRFPLPLRLGARGPAPKTPRKGILLIYAILNVKTIIL